MTLVKYIFGTDGSMADTRVKQQVFIMTIVK